MKEFSIHWLEDIIDEIIAKNPGVAIINTGKTTSGSIHIGIMRELIISDAIHRKLKERGLNAEFWLFIDDYDPAKTFPDYALGAFIKNMKLSKKEINEKYLGKPFSDIPDPYGCHESYSKHFAMELIDTFEEFQLHPRIIWTHEFYEKKEMKDAIRTALKKVEIIRDIYRKYVKPTLPKSQQEDYEVKLKTWMPATVVCQKCGKLQLKKEGEIIQNRVISYNPDDDTVTYKCPNCGFEGVVKIENARIKLTWRVDWPAKWFVARVTCEPAGKDHCVKGGAYDTGLEISRRVFGYEGPIKVPYEWVRLGERDMKTHKGIVFTPKEFLEIANPELVRYLVLKTEPKRSISIRPEAIPQLIDEYEIFEKIFYNEADADDKTRKIINYLYPLTRPDADLSQRPLRLPYRFAIVISQLDKVLTEQGVIDKAIEVIKKQYKIERDLTDKELNEVKKTLARARMWVEKFGSDRYRIEIPEDVSGIKEELSPEQIEGLKQLLSLLSDKKLTADELQFKIFEIGKSIEGLGHKKMFQAIYKVILNKKFGPRVGPFLMALDRAWVIDRIKRAIS